MVADVHAIETDVGYDTAQLREMVPLVSALSAAALVLISNHYDGTGRVLDIHRLEEANTALLKWMGLQQDS